MRTVTKKPLGPEGHSKAVTSPRVAVELPQQSHLTPNESFPQQSDVVVRVWGHCDLVDQFVVTAD